MSFLKYLDEVEEKSKDSIQDKILDFFAKNKNPEDSKVHALAEELGLAPDKLESEIYKILSDIMTGGLAGKKGTTAESVDKEQLDMGREVEKEHTSIPKIAEIIALSHLAEDSQYYSKLKELKL